MTNDIIEIEDKILNHLLRKTCFKAKYEPIEKAIRVCPKHQRGDAKKAVKRLYADGLLNYPKNGCISIVMEKQSVVEDRVRQYLMRKVAKKESEKVSSNS